MARINLVINVDIENYKQLVERESGGFAGFLSRVPVVGFFIACKVDGVVESKIKESLGDEVLKGLEPQLRAQGVKAQVSYEYD